VQRLVDVAQHVHGPAQRPGALAGGGGAVRQGPKVEPQRLQRLAVHLAAAGDHGLARGGRGVGRRHGAEGEMPLRVVGGGLAHVVGPTGAFQEHAAAAFGADRAIDRHLEGAAVGMGLQEGVQRRQQVRPAALEIVQGDDGGDHVARPRPGLGGGGQGQAREGGDTGGEAHPRRPP
jgi:hypothetical protein